MKLSFQHVALIGKYQSPVSEAMAENVRKDLESIAQFLVDQGCSVALEAQTARHTGLTQYAALDAAGIQPGTDRRHPAVHHVRGGDHVGAGLGVGERGLGEQLQGGVVVHLLTHQTVTGPRWVRETHGPMSLPLYVRPGAVIARAMGTERPEYSLDDVVLQAFEVGTMTMMRSGAIYPVYKLMADEGAMVQFDEVLMVGGEGNASVGAPLVAGAVVPPASVLRRLAAAPLGGDPLAEHRDTADEAGLLAAAFLTHSNADHADKRFDPAGQESDLQGFGALR